VFRPKSGQKLGNFLRPFGTGPRARLTDAAIRSAVPSGKTIKMFDGGGLYLELAPSGRKWRRLKYRYAGVEKRISLGTYPQTTLKEARQARDSAKKHLQQGSDPSACRKNGEGSYSQGPATHGRKGRARVTGPSVRSVERRYATDGRSVAQE
jgi:Arm domain-containing DNA-binding protein